MRIAITGSTGLVGSALVPALRADGHEVVRLVRGTPQRDDEARWDPSAGQVDPGALRGTDAVVHLAGVPIAPRPWTAGYKRALLASRVDGTLTIARACAAADSGPRVLLSASAVGWYGDTGERAVAEGEPAGGGFLSDVVVQWEAGADPARAAGLRVVHLRSGVVLSPDGGMLGTLLLPFRLGLGGRLGSGRQWMSWISLPDEIAAIRFLLTADAVEGPVNLTAPAPVRNAEFTRELAAALHRPAALPVPLTPMRWALGQDFVRDFAAVSQRVCPQRLQDEGFAWAHPELRQALAALL